MGQSTIDNPEILVTKSKTNKKYTMQYVMETTIRTYINTKNVSRTWAFIQPTGGKEEPNIVYITNQAHVHNVTMYRKQGLKCW